MNDCKKPLTILGTRISRRIVSINVPAAKITLSDDRQTPVFVNEELLANILNTEMSTASNL